jgi:MerR family mercuric resistance operon transcriptional regulator
MQNLTIGQLAERAGVGVETIRFYERKGLVTQPPRPERGRRTYPPDTAERVRFIRRAKELGFSLREISELLALGMNPETGCADVRERALVKIAHIGEKIESLQRMKDALEKLSGICAGRGPISECPILEALRDPGKGQRIEVMQEPDAATFRGGDMDT